MRVLVLGGTGFIGSHIVERLTSLGHDVAIFHRSGAAPAGVLAVHGDRNRLAASAGDFRSLSPEVVVDAIAFTEAQALGLVSAFTGIAKRIVVLSSGDVYRAYDRFHRHVTGLPEPTPLTESSPLRERLYPYGGDYEKILVERAVLGHPEIPATILRLPMVYGPGNLDGSKRRFWLYAQRMHDGRPAILLDRRTARWRAPWGYVADVAEAVRLAVDSEADGRRVYNVCEQESRDLQSWVEELAAVIGWRGRMVLADEICPPPSSSGQPRCQSASGHGFNENPPRSRLSRDCISPRSVSGHGCLGARSSATAHRSSAIRLRPRG